MQKSQATNLLASAQNVLKNVFGDEALEQHVNLFWDVKCAELYFKDFLNLKDCILPCGENAIKDALRKLNLDELSMHLGKGTSPLPRANFHEGFISNQQGPNSDQFGLYQAKPFRDSNLIQATWVRPGDKPEEDPRFNRNQRHLHPNVTNKVP